MNPSRQSPFTFAISRSAINAWSAVVALDAPGPNRKPLCLRTADLWLAPGVRQIFEIDLTGRALSR